MTFPKEATLSFEDVPFEGITPGVNTYQTYTYIIIFNSFQKRIFSGKSANCTHTLILDNRVLPTYLPTYLPTWFPVCSVCVCMSGEQVSSRLRHPNSGSQVHTHPHTHTHTHFSITIYTPRNSTGFSWSEPEFTNEKIHPLKLTTLISFFADQCTTSVVGTSNLFLILSCCCSRRYMYVFSVGEKLKNCRSSC